MTSFDLDEIARLHVVLTAAAPAATVGVGSTRGRRRIEIGAAGHVGAKPARADTIFDLASLTKPFVAVTVARLAERGRLDFNAPLDTLLPELRGTPTGPVPLELLLAHRAGLEAHLPLFAPLVQKLPFERARALEAIALARRPECLDSAPAEGFQPVYSDLGYLLVGLALERSEGQALDAIVEREVCAELGIEAYSSRRFRVRSRSFSERVAATEDVPFRGGELRGQVHDENAWATSGHGLAGHAGLFGTAEAVVRFGCALLDALAGQSAWLRPESIQRLIRERAGGSLRAGFDGKSGANPAAGACSGPRTFGHLGFTGTSIWCDPDSETVSVLLSNRVCPSRQNARIRSVRPLVHAALFGFFGL